jgi:hypothetical protein
MLIGAPLLDMFMPLSSIFFILISFSFMFHLISHDSGKKNFFIFLSLIYILLLSTNKFYLYHSFYFHSNFLTMIYFSLGVMGICLYIKEKKNTILFSSVFALALSCLIRKEMLFFSLLPLIYLNYKNLLTEDKITKLKLLFIYFIIGHLYHFKALIIYFFHNYEILATTKSHGGNIFIIPSIITLLIIVMAKPFDLLKNRYIRIFIILTILIMCIFNFSNIFETFTALNSLLFKSGGWGITWMVVFLSIFLIIIFRLFGKKYSILDFTNNKKDKQIIDYLLFIIFTFFASRIFLYAFYTSIKDTNFFDSGNRVLSLILPVSLILLIYFTKMVLHKSR